MLSKETVVVVLRYNLVEGSSGYREKKAAEPIRVWI
jgi:hypothetical protein